MFVSQHASNAIDVLAACKQQEHPPRTMRSQQARQCHSQRDLTNTADTAGSNSLDDHTGRRRQRREGSLGNDSIDRSIPVRTA